MNNNNNNNNNDDDETNSHSEIFHISPANCNHATEEAAAIIWGSNGFARAGLCWLKLLLSNCSLSTVPKSITIRTGNQPDRHKQVRLQHLLARTWRTNEDEI